MPYEDVAKALIKPPSSRYAQQASDATRAVANALLIEPGWELGGKLQSIAEGQGTFGDYAGAGLDVAGAFPTGIATKAPLLAAIFSPVFHGTSKSIRGAIRSGGMRTGGEGAAFVTDSPKDAYEFALMKARSKQDAKVMKGSVDDTGFKTVNVKGEIYDPNMMDEILSKAREEGYPGVKIRNIQNFEYGDPSTSWALFDPSLVNWKK